jgi:hypothetical protein
MINIKSTFRAASLFNAILIALLMAVTCTGLISLAYYHRVLKHNADLQEKLVANCDSGIALLQAIKNSEYEEVKDLYENGSDSVFLKKQNWGFFEVISSEAVQHDFRGRQSERQCLMIGVQAGAVSSSALYLKDSFKPLTLSGRTQINGAAYLPKAGVKGGYVNGQTYQGTDLIYGEKKRSTNQLPTLNKDKIKQIKELERRQANRNIVELNGDVIASFYEPTRFYRDKVIYINQQAVKGNVCLIADSLVYISKDTQIEDILVFAPNIYIEPDFKGNLQAYGTERVEIAEQTELNYPSIIGLFQDDRKKEPGVLIIGENSVIDGLVLAYDGRLKQPSPKLFLKQNSLVRGQVYADAAVDFQGGIFGNLTCKGFTLRAGASVYENHLLDVEISPDKRSPYYLSPAFISSERKRGVVKRLE